MNQFTIIIPVLNEEKHIGELLKTLSMIRGENEVLVIDGGSTDKTIDTVNDYISPDLMNNLRVKLLHNQERRQANALNIGLSAAATETCIRLDGHLQIPLDCNFHKKLDCLFEVLKSTPECCAAGFKQRFLGRGLIDTSVALLAATPFLSGFSRYRYANKPCLTWNTAWLLCVNRELALQIGGFASDATPNEDQNFNRRLIAHTGKPILIYPQLPLYYQPRCTLSGLMHQYFNYGLARARASRMQAKGRRSPWMIAGATLHLLISLIYAGVILSRPVIYGSTLLFILGCNLLSVALDQLHWFRNASLEKPRLQILIAALVLSPLIAVVPSLARSSGTLWEFIRPSQRESAAPANA